MKLSSGQIFLIGAMVGTALFLLISLSTGSTYKNGQIDAINGKIYYHVVAQDDGTTAWEKIK